VSYRTKEWTNLVQTKNSDKSQSSVVEASIAHHEGCRRIDCIPRDVWRSGVRLKVAKQGGLLFFQPALLSLQ
jgi:hypothetical protein